ncbi:MAG: hypothetical protein JXR37_08145 [Kiritimatiellae bacterium]|nr:hypothetical protein [Kiritimatiellia bacterium]
MLGTRITMFVDGERMLDVTDSGNAGTEAFAWTPPTAGGWIGFRNFRANRVGIDWVQVYTR